MKTKAVYPGTFDPITFGHVDLISRAVQLFDHVIIAVGMNQNKKPLFSIDERIDLIKTVLEQHKNLSVMTFDSLLIDFVKKHEANVILRGLRTVTDFDYEFQLTSMNRVMNPDVETLFLMPAEKYMYISSSLVREIASLGGDVTPFVPRPVVSALKAKHR